MLEVSKLNMHSRNRAAATFGGGERRSDIGIDGVFSRCVVFSCGAGIAKLLGRAAECACSDETSASLLKEASHETLVLETLMHDCWRKPRTKRPFCRPDVV